jgi:hypothetical protein
LRTNIQLAKGKRIAELSERLRTTDRSDISMLETLRAHIDRVKSINSWLLDIRLMMRVLGYMIIPPIAWVGAALVEDLVDQFAG